MKLMRLVVSRVKACCASAASFAEASVKWKIVLPLSMTEARAMRPLMENSGQSPPPFAVMVWTQDVKPASVLYIMGVPTAGSLNCSSTKEGTRPY